MFVTFTLVLILKYVLEMASLSPLMCKPTWQKIADDKRRADLAKIPALWRLDDFVLEEAKQRSSIVGSYIEELLDEESRRITALDAYDLVEMMRNSSLTAVETVNAFSKRAAYVHQLVSCQPHHTNSKLI